MTQFFQKPNYKAITLTLGLIVISFLFVWYIFAFTEPTVAPPGGNVPAPLNVGPLGQSKEAGLILNTGGATIGLIVDKGNVGIGTPSPGEKLEVNGSVFVNQEGEGFVVDAFGAKRVGLMKYSGIEGALTHNSVTPLRFGRYSASDITAAGTFTEEMRIDTAGNVGIGMLSPSEKLNVFGGNVTFERNDAPMNLSILSNGWGASVILEGQGGGKTWTMKAQNSSDLAFVDWDGDIPFEIYGDAFDKTLIVSAHGGINMFTGTESGQKFIRMGDTEIIPPGVSPDTINLYVADRGGTAGKGALHIQTEDGTRHVFGDLVGIGTTSPTSKLSVSTGRGTSGGITLLDSGDADNIRAKIRTSNSGHGILELFDADENRGVFLRALGTSQFISPNFRVADFISPSPSFSIVGISNTSLGGRMWQFLSFGETSGHAGKFSIQDANAAAYRLTIDTSGNVGIGTRSPGFKLDVAGSAHASSFPVSSDVRFKTNVAQITNALEKLEKIRGVSFDWNELYASLDRSTGHREIGVIAQEIETVFPELVTTWGDESYKAVDYGRLTAVLVEAVKELKADNEVLKQRIEVLEGR